MIDVIEKNPGPKLRARAIIGQRLRDFQMLTVAMSAIDVEQLLEWLGSQEFTETCRLAGADPANVKGKFHKLIDEGNRNNVRNAIN